MQRNHKENSSTTKTKIFRTRNYQERSVPKFLKKVFYILEENKHGDLLSWSNDGLAIVIKKPTEFAENVLPLYFKHNNFASFIRQLNMYKFKKRKCYQYDHVYYHEMFQHGKIDLLRNIQRKCNEATQMTPIDLQDLGDDLRVDVDQLMQENLHYRRIHKTLSTQIQFNENKMKELKSEVSNLYSEKIQTEANESFLKKIIKTLTKVYGYENIARVIELDVEDTDESSVPKESNNQITCAENSRTFGDDDRSLFQLSNSSDDIYLEDYCQESPEYELSEEFPLNGDTPYEKYQIIYNPNNSASSLIKQQPFQEAHWNHMTSSKDYEYSLEAIKASNPQAYRSWIKECERKNMEQPFNNSNNSYVKDVEIDDPYREKNQLLCGSYF